MKISKSYDSLDLAIDDPSLYDSLALAPDDSSDDSFDDLLGYVYGEGTIEIHHLWGEIQTKVQIFRETEKAYFGNVTVNMVIDGGLGARLYHKKDTWIPISMSQNPYWICTVMFGHPEKVSNKRFDEDEDYFW